MQQQQDFLKSFSGRHQSYSWIIVGSCALMIALTYGLTYSYSVFFKPLADHFVWDRATVSLIYSMALIVRGFASIGTGWLADNYSHRKTMFLCGALIGVGFLLCGQVTALWHFFLFYGVIVAIGMSGIFGIGTTLVSQWFTRNRGLALGIVASGSGLGTFFIVPGVERLINAFDWAQTYRIIGFGAGGLMIAATLFLRPSPLPATVLNIPKEKDNANREQGATVREALRDLRLYIIMLIFIPFFFGIQIVMVHLVNYATDTGIDPLMAATFVSVIGIVSITGRISIGIIADRMGVYTGLILTCVMMLVSFVLLLYTHVPWSFYLFAVLFSFPYGGEVTQIPIVIGRYFGTSSMATLMGLVQFTINLSGAGGSWVAGKLFDVTGRYDWAFILGAVAAAFSLTMVLLLRWADQKGQKAI